MKLTLQQPITFTKKIAPQEKSCPSSFDSLLHLFDTLPIGADGCVTCEAIMTDEICIVNSIDSSYNSSVDTVDIVRSIPAGKYVFQQLPFPPATGDALMPLLNRFAISLDYEKKQKTILYIRLYKEGQFTIAVQFFAPTHTTAE